MIPVRTEMTNCVLKGTTPDVIDLPVTRFDYSDGVPAVESCWRFSDEELQEVIRTGKIYFAIWGTTHPPICLSTTSFVEEASS